jgi:penicillin amidase
MKKRKIFGYVMVGLTLLVISVFFILYHLNARAIPDYNKNFELVGLKGKVEVYRDSFAIPHIFAKNEEDLYRVVGYLTAQDRLWQMDLLRRVTTGRLSEIFGKDLIKVDMLMRALRIPEKSEKVLAHSDASVKRILNAYADGVNQFISASRHKLPIEFVILGYKPERWKVTDCANLIGYIAWDLNGSWNAEIILHKLEAKLSKAQVADFIPGYDSTQSTVYSTKSINGDDWQSELLKTSEKLSSLGLQVFHGSNNWVVSGSKTATGKPMLANDMHLGFNAPGIWYQMHQVIPGKLNVTGVVLPGQPFIVSGHNDSIAWGLTNVMNDDIDFYHETLNPADSNQYKLDGQWKNLLIKHEKIAVKGQDTVRCDLKFTHRGPVISGLKQISKETISMHWMGNEMSNELRSIFLLNRAKNWSDFRDAMKTFISISQNTAYADVRGNIGMYCCAGVPIRKGNPIEVFPGDTSEYDWQGMVPFDQLPHKFNPAEGFAISANNRTIDSAYPHYISNWFDLPFRYDRIHEMLSTDKKLTVSDMTAIQTDFKSKHVAYYLPGLIESLKNKHQLNRNEQNALLILENWHGEMDAESPAAAIFEVFFNHFIENVLKDELGNDLFKEFLVDKIIVRNTIHNIWQKRNSVLYDDVNTKDKVETFDDMVFKSFSQTMADLEKGQGNNVYSWQWGKIHTFTLEHPLGKVKILDVAFHLNRGPFEIGGSFHTVAPYSYWYNNPFKVTSGASQRHVYDLSDWDNSYTIIPTGNSGIPASKHYCDQTLLYLEGKYHHDWFSEKLAKRNYLYKAVFSPFQ